MEIQCYELGDSEATKQRKAYIHWLEGLVEPVPTTPNEIEKAKLLKNLKDITPNYQEIDSDPPKTFTSDDKVVSDLLDVRNTIVKIIGEGQDYSFVKAFAEELGKKFAEGMHLTDAQYRMLTTFDPQKRKEEV